MLHKDTYYAIGLMSGSSLDGLDLCYVRFKMPDLRFEYEILQADCIEYTNEFRERLRNAANLSAFEFAKLHTELGKYFGELTNDFIQRNKINNLDFICSHGQTIFHQPNLGFTSQIGCGAQIATQTNCKVVCDLRTSDVAYSGQGAPIVPIAEKYLFSDFDVFLNIGGIANIAFHIDDSITAYDICAANTVLNYLAKQKGLDFDKAGKLAQSGTIIQSLLIELNEIRFCRQIR
jgi:anhydro-N-acetylmuramic acid kinase